MEDSDKNSPLDATTGNAAGLKKGQRATVILDLSDLTDRLGGDRDLIEMFLEDLKVVMMEELFRQLAELRAHVDRGEADTVQRAAHSLKGSAANLSATALYDAVCELEDWTKLRKLEQIRNPLAKVEQELERLRNFVASAGFAERPL